LQLSITLWLGLVSPEITMVRSGVSNPCCDLATRQLRWVNDQGAILLEPPAAPGDPSMPSQPSNLSPSAAPYSGPGAYRLSAPVYRSRFERLMNEGA